MGQIEEDYCSPEVTKLLEEKGFTKDCIRIHAVCNGFTVDAIVTPDAPTHQSAMKWLRNKGICIQVRRSFNTYLYGAIILKDVSDIYATIPSKLETYEEATEAALKYSLENLI